MKAQVILNEQHKLLPEQEKILNEKFGAEWKIYPVPELGWNKVQTSNVEWELWKDHPHAVFVFASPVPLLLANMSVTVGYNRKDYPDEFQVYLFFNSHREKKELPNGKIIFTVPQKGWELIRI